MKPQALARHWRPTWELVLVAVVTVLTSINLLVAHAPFFRTAALFSDTKAVGGNAFITDTLDPPTGLSTTGGSCISLEWTATADTYASGHRVLRGTTTGGPYTQISEVTPRATTTYADSPADGTYYYVLRSFFQNWESGNSGEATATAGWSATERVSVDTAGAQGNNKSDQPTISDDGRYVVFASDASNLVAGDTNAVMDVFVHDRQTGATTRVSVDSAGAQGNDKSDLPAISDDGRYVVFASDASDLVAGDTNAVMDVFVHDRQTGATTRVSVDSAGAQGNDKSDLPAISDDGRYVVFASDASDLVAGDTNAVKDVFVHDRQTAATTRVSVDSAGAQGNDKSDLPAISDDGRHVVFASDASDLVAGDTNAVKDVFVHDRQTATTTRVSVDSAGAQGNDKSDRPAISGDGCYAVFASDASDLVAGDTNAVKDVFVHDRQTATTTRVSVDSAGAQGNDKSDRPAISGDGCYAVFASDASDLVAGDTNAVKDVFVRR